MIELYEYFTTFAHLSLMEWMKLEACKKIGMSFVWDSKEWWKLKFHLSQLIQNGHYRLHYETVTKRSRLSIKMVFNTQGMWPLKVYWHSIPSSDPKTSPFPSAVDLLFFSVLDLSECCFASKTCAWHVAPENVRETETTPKQHTRWRDNWREKNQTRTTYGISFSKLPWRIAVVGILFVFLCVYLVIYWDRKHFCMSVGNVTYLHTLTRISEHSIRTYYLFMFIARSC